MGEAHVVCWDSRKLTGSWVQPGSGPAYCLALCVPASSSGLRSLLLAWAALLGPGL